MTAEFYISGRWWICEILEVGDTALLVTIVGGTGLEFSIPISTRRRAASAASSGRREVQ